MQVSDDRFKAESGYKFQIPSWLCMKLTSAECTVENSWWWAENMPETCRVLCCFPGVTTHFGCIFTARYVEFYNKIKLG
jgi:hypothetical protein